MTTSTALTRLCRRATEVLPASDLGLSMLSVDGQPLVVAASSPHGEVVEQLQFTLGEGPCREACDQRRPVLAPDLRLAATGRWPGYAPAALDLGVGAVFAFPLHQGGATLGALDVYRAEPGSLSEQTYARALAFADEATETLLAEHALADGPDAGAEMEGPLDRSFVVYQAQGMMQVQLGVSLAEALGRLRAHAYSVGRPLNEVAADVVARRLTLERDRP